MNERVLITAGLLYANGSLHFGHLAGAHLPADVYARYQRLKKNEVLFISGSDEYGLPITINAEKEGRSYQEYVDQYHSLNYGLFQKLDFSFDHYARTTAPFHQKLTQEFFQNLLENGYIEKKEEEHLYSEKENKFLADRYVQGECPKCGFAKARGDECPKCGASFEAKDLKNPISKLTGSTLTTKKSTHWYLKLDAFKEELLAWMANKPWKENVVKFAKNYIEELKPRAITRDSSWGVEIPLPEAQGKVFYVWFDAPIGYISATVEWAQKVKNPEKWKDFWLDPQTKYVQFIGKDNVPFHAAFFPAMILGQKKGYHLVDMLSANEFFLLEGKQFSKSDGWYVDLASFLEKYSSDQIRYALCANAPEQSDADFSFKDFQMRCNAELLGKLGNFVHRTLTFTRKVWPEKIPSYSFLEMDASFLQEAQGKLAQIGLCYENCSTRKACVELMSLASFANHFFDQRKPWSLQKLPLEEGEKSLHSCLFVCLELVKYLALASFPMIPQASQKIWKMLGIQEKLEDLGWQKAFEYPITHIQEPSVLFAKIEDAQIEQEIQTLGKTMQEQVAVTQKNLSFEDFQKLKLQIGQILSAEKVEKSRKLYKLEVDLGSEKRTVVSGIATHFSEQDLIGKKVVLVTNLAPAKIMGIESQGMILAAEHEGKLELPSIQNLPAGSFVS